jgi:hypothetical protein
VKAPKGPEYSLLARFNYYNRIGIAFQGKIAFWAVLTRPVAVRRLLLYQGEIL